MATETPPATAPPITPRRSRPTQRAAGFSSLEETLTVPKSPTAAPGEEDDIDDGYGGAPVPDEEARAGPATPNTGYERRGQLRLAAAPRTGSDEGGTAVAIDVAPSSGDQQPGSFAGSSVVRVTVCGLEATIRSAEADRVTV